MKLDHIYDSDAHIECDNRLDEAKAILVGLASSGNTKSLDSTTINYAMLGVVSLLDQAKAALIEVTKPSIQSWAQSALAAERGGSGAGVENWDAIEAHTVMDEVAGDLRSALVTLETYKRNLKSAAPAKMSQQDEGDTAH